MASPLAIARKPLGCAAFAGGQLKPIDRDFTLFFQALLTAAPIVTTHVIEAVAVAQSNGLAAASLVAVTESAAFIDSASEHAGLPDIRAESVEHAAPADVVITDGNQSTEAGLITTTADDTSAIDANTTKDEPGTDESPLATEGALADAIAEPATTIVSAIEEIIAAVEESLAAPAEGIEEVDSSVTEVMTPAEEDTATEVNAITVPWTIAAIGIPVLNAAPVTQRSIPESQSMDTIITEIETITMPQAVADEWTIAAIGIPTINGIAPVTNEISESLIEDAEDIEDTEAPVVASQNVITAEDTIAEAGDGVEWTIATIGIPIINAIPTTTRIPAPQVADIDTEEILIPQVGPVEDDQVPSETACTEDIPAVDATPEFIEAPAIAADDEPISVAEDLTAVEERADEWTIAAIGIPTINAIPATNEIPACTASEAIAIPATESVADDWTIAAIGIPVLNAIPTTDVTLESPIVDEQVPIEQPAEEPVQAAEEQLQGEEDPAQDVVPDLEDSANEDAETSIEAESDQALISGDVAPTVDSIVEYADEQEPITLPTQIIAYPLIFEDDFDAAISNIFDADFQRLMDIDSTWSVPQLVAKGKSEREITRERLANKSTSQFNPQNLRLEKAAEALSIDGTPPVLLTQAPARAMAMPTDMIRSHSRKSSSSSFDSSFSTDGAFDSVPCPGTPVTEYNMTPTKNDDDIPAGGSVTGDDDETTE
jgi:hypothetical protein